MSPIPIHKILCPTDLTVDSQRILATGCKRAKQSGAELHLLHVVDGLMNPTSYLGPPFDEGSTWEEAIQHRAQADLDRVTLPPELQEIPVVRVLRIGLCAASILEYVSQARIDLIVLGPHGSQSFLAGKPRREYREPSSLRCPESSTVVRGSNGRLKRFT